MGRTAPASQNMNRESVAMRAHDDRSSCARRSSPSKRSPAEPANPSVAFIQRTMNRVARSTPENPAKVRVEFYGQSITAQSWTKLVGEDLVRRYPSVQFEFHNPAIGGFQSPNLIRTAEHDLYPWYPELLVFHVYGPVEKYEEIIRNVRARTTAEIILWTSHLGAGDTLDKNPDADSRIVRIREIAAKYDCMLIDVRRKWIAHLQEAKLPPQAFLSDVIHLNDDGIRLMASFIAPEIIHVPGLNTTPQAGTVREVPVDSPEISRQTDRWVLPFTGNRVVAVSNGLGTGAAEILLDGKPLADRPELWAATRPSTAPDIWMPAIKRVSFDKAPVAEDWTLTCLDDSTSDGKRVHFRVTGSQTGDDGEGYSNAKFVSQSGRVVIDPTDWHLAWCLDFRKLPLPAGFQIRWKTYPLFSSPCPARPIGEETVLLQNCSNGPHQLTLVNAPACGISSLRIHQPAIQVTP